jgi:predicted AlkP superfamily pyrophosphatase or phosphodiesterase
MAQRVLLCSLDGVRPDAILAADTPTLQRLAAEGAHTWKARSVMPSVTLPCHTSMLRGVDVSRHGITTNTFIPLARPVPSVLEVAAQQGKRVGFFYNWEPLRDLAAPDTMKVSVCYGGPIFPPADIRIADAAIAHVDELDFLFVYFGAPDEEGHRHGWMSAPYLKAIENADACLARVLAALGPDTDVCVVSDHGGHGRSHGTDCDEDMTVPFILNGPAIRSGHTIAGPVVLYDVCPTVAHLLGVAPSPIWDGQVVHEALV